MQHRILNKDIGCQVSRVNIRITMSLLFLALLNLCLTNSLAAAPRCTENATSIANGWGWENNASCEVCNDTPPLGDGWGWNGLQSCRIEVLPSPAAATAPVQSGSAVCVDTPPFDDGWGWDGTESCRLSGEAVPLVITSQASYAPQCVDISPVGDGWGWNGTNSCSTVWSVASYPGWIYQTSPPENIPYGYFTHIMHFAMYPTSAGGVSIGDIFTDENADRAVAAAHAANRKIILVIGGEGEGDKFVGATEPANMQRFVRAIINRMQRHGYDGISIDWEEQVIDSRLIALIKILANEFSAMNPRPLLTVDVLSNFVSADATEQMAPYVDAVNIMSYFKPNKIEDEFRYYQSAGLDPRKTIMGIGLFPDADDSSAARVQEKMRYARQLGFKGVELWSAEFADWRGDIIQTFVANRWR